LRLGLPAARANSAWSSGVIIV